MAAHPICLPLYLYVLSVIDVTNIHISQNSSYCVKHSGIFYSISFSFPFKKMLVLTSKLILRVTKEL